MTGCSAVGVILRVFLAPPSLRLSSRVAAALPFWALCTLTWQQAIKALFLEKVTVLRSYDDWICHSQRISIPVPSVVMMNRYHHQKGTVNFTRRNVFLRDRFHCQYCMRHFSSEHLTVDHVIPKSLGGRLRWKNVVAACLKCNLSKGATIVPPSKTPYDPWMGRYWDSRGCIGSNGFTTAQFLLDALPKGMKRGASMSDNLNRQGAALSGTREMPHYENENLAQKQSARIDSA